MSPQTPNALEHLEDIAERARTRTVAIFLDFDGTLAPIVDRPEQARIDSAARDAVIRLALRCPVAIVSGRDLEDARTRVGIDTIYYAGSHGFDIAGPQGTRHEHPKGVESLPALDDAERALRAALAPIDGAIVDRKRFSIAVHFRLVREEQVTRVEESVDAVLAAHVGLRKGRGKKVFELQPDVNWNKGTAVRWLLQALDLDRPHVLPIYIGDDVTDEDAFRILTTNGLGIVVLDHPRPTAARYRLRDPGAVRQFLERLADALEHTP